MGGIWYQAGEFANAMSELIGHKSGLALSRQNFIDHLEDAADWANLFRLGDDEIIRIRSEAVEALVAQLLYRWNERDVAPESLDNNKNGRMGG